MSKTGLMPIISSFVLGLMLGGFIAVTVVREALPLRNHFVLTILYTVYILPIVVIMFFWYTKVIKTCEKMGGEKFGKVLSTILSFLIVTIIIIFIIVVGLFFAAIS